MEEKEKRGLAGWWSKKSKAKKISFWIWVFFFAISIYLMGTLIYCRQIFGDKIGDKILGSGVSNGWVWLGNAMSASGITWLLTFVVIIITFLLVFVATSIVRACTSGGGKKAHTVGSLICSLLKYIAIIVAVGFILAVWGVDVAGILAGVSILTLIIGLGCQSLIQDVVSGLFIVFDDYFAVGDTVIIDGFRGTVAEVGLKTTKLEDAGHNIKSISNSSITSVVNLSRGDSLVSVTMDASYNEDIERVEGIIAQNLPAIKKKIPAITDGPYYKGINNFDDGGISFQVVAFCGEGDRFQVTRDLNRELFILFQQNDILIPYNQIVVNPPDPNNRPKATAEQVKKSNEAINVQRGIGDKPKAKKKSFMKKISQSMEENVKSLEDK